MDAHALYVMFRKYKDWIPQLSTIKSAIKSQDVNTLELIALMMVDRGKPFILNELGLDDPLKNTFNHMVAKSSILLRSVRGESKAGGESQGGDTPLIDPPTERVGPYQSGGESKGGDTPLIDPPTERVDPYQSGGGRGDESKSSALKTKKSFVADISVINECSTLFLSKSKANIKSLATLFKLHEPMLWVKRSASKIEAGNEVMPNPRDFVLLDDTNRFVHVSSSKVFDFVKALKREDVKTFSWNMTAGLVINLAALRQKIKKRLFAGATTSDVTVFVIILCSIGLPIFKLVTKLNTAEIFLKHWYSGRFKKLTSENIIRTLCKDMFPPEHFVDKLTTPETEARLFLDAYDKSKFSLIERGSSALTCDTYMFRRWYWYPSKDELSTIVERAQNICNAV